MSTMPMVPEERESVSSETIESLDDNNTLGPLSHDVDDTASDAKSALTQSSSLKSGDSESKMLKKSVSLDESSSRIKKKKAKVKRQPKAKLTFVNGQFIDLTTEEGQEMLKASFSASEEGSGPMKGILTTINTGHCGILGQNPPQSPGSKAKAKNPPSHSKSMPTPKSGKSNITSTNSMGSNSVNSGRSKSDYGSEVASFCSIESDGSRSTQEGLPTTDDMKDAISSIVVLGDGYILTASKVDRVIKMWRVENVDGNTTVEFVRDFTGHKVGVTCLAKVDHKGRFLSTSKERRMKLWDSRYNCENDDDGKSRTLLATFDKMDRRNIQEIAITQEGTYVRPTDKIDMAMAAAMTKKAMKDGSGSVQKAAQQRHILACSCEFATISGRHPVVKMWSVKHIDQEQEEIPPEGNVAEVKLDMELNHNAVVESIASLRGKGLLLTGDRMGNVMLWRSGKNVFLPGSSPIWSSMRTFSWKPKSHLSTVEESMQFAITSLTFLQGNELFVSGSKVGNLRVWKVDGTRANGETVNKEEICITGAHNLAITAIEEGPQLNGSVKSLTFSSASEDGKVLSFAIPAAKVGSCNPCCFNAVNLGIANRYFVGTDPAPATALACLGKSNTGEDLLISGGTKAALNILKPPGPPKQGQQNDALVLYRQAMEEESLTLNAIGEKICKEEAIESRNRKLQMKSYKDCFLGSDAISFLVDNQHAASRKDAVDLGRVLATHLTLFECVSKKGKMLEDDKKSYYRWSSDVTGGSKSSSKKEKLKRWATAPGLQQTLGEE